MLPVFLARLARFLPSPIVNPLVSLPARERLNYNGEQNDCIVALTNIISVTLSGKIVN